MLASPDVISELLSRRRSSARALVVVAAVLGAGTAFAAVSPPGTLAAVPPVVQTAPVTATWVGARLAASTPAVLAPAVASAAPQASALPPTTAAGAGLGTAGASAAAATSSAAAGASASAAPDVAGGDTRSSGTPPSFVGQPILAAVAVIVLGLLTAAAATAYVRVSGR